MYNNEPSPFWEIAGIAAGFFIILRALIYWWSYKE